MAELSPLLRLLWVPFFAAKALFYLAVDYFNRSLFNKLFYMNYRGRLASEADAMAQLVFDRYYSGRFFPDAMAKVASLKRNGYSIVLVTGSPDFLMQPIADVLNADDVLATELEVKDGKFTGKMRGNALAGEEKAVRMREYAASHGVDLAQCYAFADSIADQQMLEAVGNPVPVRPDGRLAALAKAKEWPVLKWELPKPSSGGPVPSTPVAT
eukprot:jgi/Mesvir1/15277/Mv06495-RA.1